ncbi:hypothetical protein SAMN05880501_12319 [Ureibacillus xyleni]|uniref:Uncharacterized protein n=1 Tax=Ureibacillus xyleni TaxID=614648 RepID=A0A285TVF8_9BACL|nr:hypothetical protein [Ureibacillus xyleni]SOC27557.1 hypothetical protein SAMN05880501_12319 [Ureibacillus xyleni]
MELHALQQKLSQQFHKTTILERLIWCVPVHTVNIAYKPILRTKMDILMKMLLISLQKAKFKKAEQLSEILLVEELFIQDLLSKMQKTGLITKEEHYRLTEKGLQQLTSGVFEEDQDMTSMETLYSPTHQTFLHGEIEAVLDFEDFPEEIYRHQVQVEELQVDNEKIIKELRSLQTDEEAEEESNLFITSVESFEDIQVNDVPCIEFVLFDDEKGQFTSRVWNTLTNNWDEILQHQIEEKEKTIWKERFLTKK